MVDNKYIQCNACGCITRIRLQIGKLNEHPIVVTCGRCTAPLDGKVKINHLSQKLSYEFKNADIVEFKEKNNTLPIADFVIECSGEFPTKKLTEDNEEIIFRETPFIRQMGRMGLDISFYQTIAQLNEVHSNWSDYQKLFALYKNNNKYLIPEMKKLLMAEIPSLNAHSDILEAFHLMEVEAFFKPLRRELINHYSISVDILKMNSNQLKLLITFLNSNPGYGLKELQFKIYKLYSEFIELYPNLIPAISIQYSRPETIDYEFDGSTTSTFDTVNDFYKNLYEDFAQLLVIPVALNNIKYRGDLNSMASNITPEIKSLDRFINESKGNRYHYYLDNEFYTAFTGAIVNKDIRNAIGHHDTEYDEITQLITYYPNPKDKNKKGTEFLLEFENEIVHLFQGVLTISEYIYRLRELELSYNGDKEMISSLSRMLGIYDPCPCGSNKKVKFCHNPKKNNQYT